MSPHPNCSGIFRVKVRLPAAPAIVRVRVPEGPRIVRVRAADVTAAMIVARDEARAAASFAERERERAEAVRVNTLADRLAAAAAAAAAQSAALGAEAFAAQAEAASRFSLEIPQVSPASVWLLRHGLGRRPSVTLIDSAGDVFVADVRYLDADTIQVTLSAPASGRALLN